tara:strand:- start:913 stop:1293 length:381 start_codon:yes stop_codon:yes gene_type:complete
MSTLKADTIQSTSGGAATLTKQEATKVRCLFNGTGTIAIREGFNSSSLVDVGVGIYKVNYTNNTSTTNTVTTGSNIGDGTTSDRTNGQVGAFGSVTTALTHFATNYDNNDYTDYTHVGVIVHGNLA